MHHPQVFIFFLFKGVKLHKTRGWNHR